MWGFTTSKTSTKTTPNNPSETRLTEAVMQLYGIRNIVLGLSIFAVWWSGDSRTLGLVVLADSLVAFGDGFVQRAVCGRGEWQHWSFLPVGWGLAGVLND